jgi:hypothetical protein
VLPEKSVKSAFSGSATQSSLLLGGLACVCAGAISELDARRVAQLLIFFFAPEEGRFHAWGGEEKSKASRRPYHKADKGEKWCSGLLSSSPYIMSWLMVSDDLMISHVRSLELH